MKHFFLAFLFLSGVFAVTASAAENVPAEKQLTFEKHVRPILKATCFHCHGEEEELEGALDIRLARFLLKGGESGPAIVPGKPKESLLVERIESGDMPPGDMTLTAEEIAILSLWIRQGAKTARPEPESLSPGSFTREEKTFWSFQPIERPRVPAVKNLQQVRTPIDAFVVSRLEKNKLNFSPDADRRTLVRRAYFDLHGLPPTPEQVANFVNDNSPNAYEALIDRLLVSPGYGERWGRHWLDVAGYADSEGYVDADPERDSAYRFRDYVIESFNADKPFDQFIREQLAGDEMLTPPYKNLTPDQVEKLVATGFLRMGPDGTGAANDDAMLARHQVMAETIKIVSSSLMGLTVGCAQCHNHRYDPIPQTDYYRLRAVFEPAYNPKQWRAPAARKISLYTDADRKVAAGIEAEAKKVDAERDEMGKRFVAVTLEDQLLQVDEKLREPLRVAYNTPGAKRTEEQKDLLDLYPRILKISVGSLYLYDREIRVAAAKIDSERNKKQPEFIKQAFAAQLAKLPKGVQQQLRAANAAAVQSRTDAQRKLLTEHAGILVTAANLATFDPDGAAELERMKKAAVDLRATQKADRIKALQDKAAAIRATKPEEGFVRALTEVPGQIPETFFFERGDHEQPKQKLAPAGLSVLAEQNLGEINPAEKSLPTTGRRLAFAKRLTSGSHPLTARVLVNRIWLHHFGRGIVETPEDFGALGARPTHPELLDWLADDFMQNGWQLKRLHKLIMTSTAYRQSSLRNAAQDAVDPDNRLYGRMSLRRLEAEIVRDAVLAVSGQLNTKLFGKPVPVMEDDVGQIIIGKENLDGERKPGAAINLNGEEFRRSLYVQVRRSRPLAVLDTFDAPAMEPNCTNRNSSTVAPQALLFMNSRFSVDYAERMAKRVQASAGSDPKAQVTQAWLLAFSQQPTKEQIADSVNFLNTQQKIYTDSHPKGVKGTSRELALAGFCQALLSSNRFLYVD